MSIDETWCDHMPVRVDRLFGRRGDAAGALKVYRESLAIARVAEAAGMGCYVGCMIETSLGTAAYLQLALAAAPVTWGCELFGPLLLQGDVTRRPVEYADGRILSLDGPGLGVEIDEAALKEWTRRT